MNICKNCNASADGNYCSNCGQALTLKRIDSHYITHEIEHLLHFERGIFYTIRELLLRPGQNIRSFITVARSRLVKPIVFLIITSLFYSLVIHFFHIDDGYVKMDEDKVSTTGLIFAWIKEHYGYANIMMGIFIAFWTKLFFRKYEYNFFEIMILLCFVMGMGMFIFALFGLVQGITHLDVMQIGSFIWIAYCTWAIGQFFNPVKAVSYVKAFASYIIGMITFFSSAVLIGSLFDWVVKL